MSVPARNVVYHGIAAALLALLGMPLVFAGAWLVAHGGSAYYLCAGLALWCVAWLLVRRTLAAFGVYALFLLATTAWAIHEVGLDGWQLLPRIALWWLIGWWMPWLCVRRAFAMEPSSRWRWLGSAFWMPVALLVALLVIVIAWFAPSRGPLYDIGRNEAHGDASAELGSASAAQLKAASADHLRLAWTHELHGGPEAAAAMISIKANGLLYACMASGEVVALDPAKGTERWRHPSSAKASDCAGVALFDSAAAASYAPVPAAPVERKPTPKGAVAMESIQFDSCPRRLFATVGDQLVALNADNGQPCSDAGRDGVIDLPDGLRGAMTAPVVVRDMVLVRAASQQADHVLAYDVHNGTLRWRHDEPHAASTRSRPLVIDEALGLAYVALDEGGVLALDVTTGTARWKHPVAAGTHLSGQPVLASLRDSVPAILAATADGDLIVLDRRNGEVVTAAGALVLPDERRVRESQMWGVTPYDQLMCRIRFVHEAALDAGSAASSLGPVSRALGDSGIALDATGRVLFARSVVLAQEDDESSGWRPMLSSLGIPCQASPWSHVVAYDLGTMSRRWIARNSPHVDDGSWPLPMPPGSAMAGGVTAVGGGLVLVAGSSSHALRAFDAATGRMVWESLEAGVAGAVPMSFIDDASGRPYVLVVIARKSNPSKGPSLALAAYAVAP